MREGTGDAPEIGEEGNEGDEGYGGDACFSR
jgi:hypothetical protein